MTRKEPGLSKLFKQLLESFDETILTLESMGKFTINGLNPTSALAQAQRQMKRLSQEIMLSANVLIGYAFSVESILHDLKGLAQTPVNIRAEA